MFREAELKGIYLGVKLNHVGKTISDLQHADDTLIFGEKSDQNVCAIKAILQLFEIVSGLKVNFHKSLLLGVHVDDRWLVEAVYFLNCKMEKLPFVHLGLPMGAYHHKLSTWKPVVEKVHKHLSEWSSKQISMGRRVVL